MKSVLISTRPKWVEKICHKIGEDETGKAIYEKRIEVRKSAPQEVPFKAYIYCTKPKKWFRFSSWGYASDECLWLSDGKIKMCDGFEFWADGKDYQCVNGKVIGEFICDKVERFEEHIEQGGLYYILSDTFNEQVQLDNWELHDYGKGKTLYGWHISDLKIYDRPKELSEFNAVCRYINEDKSCHFRKVMCPYQQFDYNEDGSINIVECSRVIIRPPQSWQYIEDLGEEE